MLRKKFVDDKVAIILTTTVRKAQIEIWDLLKKQPVESEVYLGGMDSRDLWRRGWHLARLLREDIESSQWDD